MISWKQDSLPPTAMEMNDHDIVRFLNAIHRYACDLRSVWETLKAVASDVSHNVYASMAMAKRTECDWLNWFLPRLKSRHTLSAVWLRLSFYFAKRKCALVIELVSSLVCNYFIISLFHCGVKKNTQGTIPFNVKGPIVWHLLTW